jgi:hypothetical protein
MAKTIEHQKDETGSAAEGVEVAKQETKVQNPVERLKTTKSEALRGTRAAKKEAVRAVETQTAAVESVGGTKDDRTALEAQLAPGLREMDAVEGGAIQRIEAVVPEGTAEGVVPAKTPDEIAEELMTPAQRAMSERQASDLEAGPIFVKESWGSRKPSQEELARWPDAEGISDLDGQLPDGRKLELHAALTDAGPYGDTEKALRKLKMDRFTGTIDGQELSPRRAKTLFMKGATSSKIMAFDRYRDQSKQANWEVDEQGLEKKYKPTDEELAQAEDMLTPTQRRMSEYQERDVQRLPYRDNSGFLLMMREASTPTAEEKVRWPNASRVFVFDGLMRGEQFKDMAHPDQKIKLTMALEPDMDWKAAPADNFAGTIDGKEMPAEQARRMFIQRSEGVAFNPSRHYGDAERANAEVEAEAIKKPEEAGSDAAGV